MGLKETPEDWSLPSEAPQHLRASGILSLNGDIHERLQIIETERDAAAPGICPKFES
jgi:hypothetical protein